MKRFPDWENYYREEKAESMPWYNPELDSDLKDALEKLQIKKGRALDLGAGPGTQAIALAKMGFEVTATDISETAVKNAAKRAEGLKNINFKTDNILESRLADNGKFDFVFDRGCFHVLPPERREDYAEKVYKLLKPQGYLFLKCFSHKETTVSGGPYRFTPEEIKKIFGGRFKVLSVTESFFQGTLDPLPKALFSILKKPE